MLHITFFILKVHFCPPCPSQRKATGAAAPPSPSSASLQVVFSDIVGSVFNSSQKAGFFLPESLHRDFTNFARNVGFFFIISGSKLTHT